MVFDDEVEFELNENTASQDSTKTEPQLEKYGVWIKKGPENLESYQDKPDMDISIDNTDFTEDSVLEDNFNAPEEQIESMDEEINSLIDTNEIPEDFSIENSIIEESPVIEKQEEIAPAGLDLPENLDLGGIDLSAFENKDVPMPKTEEQGEVSVEMDSFFSSDSSDGEVDLSDFFSDGESIDFDDFMSDSGTKKEPEIIDEEPLDIQLEFDDNFVLETKADPVSQVEFIGFDGESGEMSFDDLFDNIQDEGSAFPSDFGIESETPKIPEFDTTEFTPDAFDTSFMTETPSNSETTEPVVESKNETTYDDASEFDDLLSSLDEATAITDTPEEARQKKLIQDYDITVTMDEEDLSEEDEEDEEVEDNDLDDISLFQSNEDIENFKQQSKNNGQPIAGMKVLEAQSSMDFDEIDKILADGDFDFPSDTVTEEKTENIEDITINDESIVTSDEINIEETSLEINDIDNINTTNETLEETVSEEIIIEDSLDEFNNTQENIDNEDSMENMNFVDNQDDDNISLDLDLSTQSEEENDEINVSLGTNEDSDIINEESLLTDDDPLDNTFISLDEENSEEQVINDNTEIINSEDELLDMDFTEEITENTNDFIEDEITSEDLSEDLSDDTFVPEMEVNEIEDEIISDDISEDLSEDTFVSEMEVNEIEDEIISDDISEDLSDDTFVPEMEVTQVEDDLTENNFTEEENIKQDDNMENNNFIKNEQTEIKTDSSNALLEKIASEITNLRSELSNLRTEFNSLKAGKEDNSEEEFSVATAEENESSGFFNDDSEDETIALSGDELNNILNNADFTTEETTEELENDEVADIDEVPENNEVLGETTEDLTETDTISNPIGDATELTDSDLNTIDEYEEDSYSEETETSNFADEVLQEPELDDLQMNNDFDDDENDTTEEIDIPKENETEFEQSETNDFIESINAIEPTISETLTEDRLKYLEDSANNELTETEDNHDEVEEDVAEEQEVIEETESEISEEDEIIQEDETEECNEPTEDVFNSTQWDNEVPSVENVLAESSNTTEENDVKVESVETSNPQPVVQNSSPTAKIQDDIKSVLVYMDQLLENLPEEKIEEFAKSEHFDTYKKLFNELGISN